MGGWEVEGVSLRCLVVTEQTPPVSFVIQCKYLNDACDVRRRHRRLLKSLIARVEWLEVEPRPLQKRHSTTVNAVKFGEQ